MNTQSCSSLSFHCKAAGLLLPGLLLLGATPAFADRIVKHFKVEARPVVTIHNPDGMITVRAWTKHEVMVTANRASSQVELEVEQTGNRVDIMTHQVSDAVSLRRRRADYEISVPEDAECPDSQRFRQRQRGQRFRRHERRDRRRRRGSSGRRRLSHHQDRRWRVPVRSLRRPPRSLFHQRQFPPRGYVAATSSARTPRRATSSSTANFCPTEITP